MTKYLLIGGPYDRARPELTKELDHILVGDSIYTAVNDPDTGENLGAYVYRGLDEA